MNHPLSIPTLLLVLIGHSMCYGIRCLENGRFYRDSNQAPHLTWSLDECSKYYLCLGGEVFNFRCSPGLLFDINRQICAPKSDVHNCDITGEAECSINSQNCGDGVCLPINYFCDGSVDCAGGQDEINCETASEKTPFCDAEKCRLPGCFCSRTGTDIPGDLAPKEVPQMVVVSFDGAINYENLEIYHELFDGKWLNPNQCPIKSTFFVSHLNSNYQQIQKLWNDEHEIAVHSVTHRRPKEWWAHNATIEDWFDEMVGEANILHKFASIRPNEIRGLRAPFFQIGWNRQFLMMEEFGFIYDSSVLAPFSNPPFWPYSFDYRRPHQCHHSQNCPTRPYQGLWEMVVNPLEVDNRTRCHSLDKCKEMTADDLYSILLNNFHRHYYSNRAPFGVHFHAKFFQNRDYLEAFQDFIAEVQNEDVWFVTNWQALSWIKNPTSLSNIKTFKPWSCGRTLAENEIVCKTPNVCKSPSPSFDQDKYLYTCASCPEQYPWVRNEFGKNFAQGNT